MMLRPFGRRVSWAAPPKLGNGTPNTGAFSTITATGSIDAGGGTNIAAKRSSFSANSEPYAVAVKYVSSGGACYFGATDNTSTPGWQISNAGGSACLNGDKNRNIVISVAAVATNATDGFLYISTCAGTPTGTPTAKTGNVPMVYDTTNNKLYVYNGAWKGVTLA